MTLPIVTERLILRRFTHDDIPDVIAFVSHPSVSRATPEIEGTEAGVGKYIDLQNSYEPFEQGECFDLAVERGEDGKVIGLLSLVCREHRQAEIGLHRIYATTSSANTGSWGVMERLGMRRESHLREAELRDGEWVDTFVYGMLAREW